MKDDRRFKKVFLDPDNLVEALNWLHAPGESCLVVGGPKVPEDARVEDCYYSADHRSLIVVLSHPSFEQVPTGECAPWLDAAKGSARFTLRKPEQAPTNGENKSEEPRKGLPELFEILSDVTKEKSQQELTSPSCIPAGLVEGSPTSAEREPESAESSGAECVLEVMQKSFWSDGENGSPVVDMIKAKDLFIAKFGRRPNRLEMSTKNLLYVKLSEQFAERVAWYFRPGAKHQQPELVEDQLAMMLNLREVEILPSDTSPPRLLYVKGSPAKAVDGTGAESSGDFFRRVMGTG